MGLNASLPFCEYEAWLFLRCLKTVCPWWDGTALKTFSFKRPVCSRCCKKTLSPLWSALRGISDRGSPPQADTHPQSHASSIFLVFFCPECLAFRRLFHCRMSVHFYNYPKAPHSSPVQGQAAGFFFGAQLAQEQNEDRGQAGRRDGRRQAESASRGWVTSASVDPLWGLNFLIHKKGLIPLTSLPRSTEQMRSLLTC